MIYVVLVVANQKEWIQNQNCKKNLGNVFITTSSLGIRIARLMLWDAVFIEIPRKFRMKFLRIGIEKGRIPLIKISKLIFPLTTSNFSYAYFPKCVTTFYFLKKTILVIFVSIFS